VATAYEAIMKATEAVARAKGPVKFTVAKPQKEAEVAALEKRLGVALPADYRTFITEHGLLDIDLGKGYGSYAAMLPIKNIEKICADIENCSYLMFDAKDPRTLIPFQYCVDKKSTGLYHFTYDPKTKRVDMRRLKYADQYKIGPQKSFTNHMRKLVEFVVQWKGGVDDYKA
jgi:hypothetical protein